MRRFWKAAVGLLSIGLVAGALLPSPAPAKSKAPKKKPMAVNIGFESFEPTIGAAPNGDLYFSTTPSPGVAIGWRASIAKSTDGGLKWEDVGPQLPTGHSNPPETNDPYIYVDPSTGRVFTFHMAPVLTCSILSFSDDGARTWTTNPAGCVPTGVWDHQTMVAAKPRALETEGYPNILHQCVNAIHSAICSRSVDGGMTWTPGNVVYPNPRPGLDCGSQHGHLASGPDGTIYLPTSLCGERPVIYISEDDGSTWRESVLADENVPWIDPTVSVDSKGNVYASYVGQGGWLYYTVSRNNGKSWSKPIQIAKGWTANMPVLVAGDPGKVVIAYPATNDLKKGYDTDGYTNDNQAELVGKVAWGANFTYSYNALSRRPKFKTTVATGKDPIGRGHMCPPATRCDYLVDFIEAVLGPDGRPYASLVDGCVDSCAKSATGPQKPGTGFGLMTTLPKGKPFCSSVCWRFKGAGKKGIDPAKAEAWANQPWQMDVALGHATLSPQLRALQDLATERRIKAVTGN